MQTIRIDSILGGQSPMANFSAKGQFRASIGIDPAQPIDDSDSVTSTVASGLLRPVASQKISGSTITGAPLWMVPNPKDGFTYVYDAHGSAYTINTSNTVTALSDAGTLTSSLGNGAEYYDNYIYFFKNTDVARYGPLNGVPGFNGTFWTGTLGLAALTNTAYPTTFKSNLQLPNHVGHRHSDGKLYFIDVSGNQGIINKISTTKVTVEGDTNSGSALAALTFGYGLWPTDIESYGSSIAISIIEASNTLKRDPVGKIAFWDTTATSFNEITWVEYPDPLITALANANGALFVFSGSYKARGWRCMQYIGGYSFKEVYYSETGEPPLPGAVDAIMNQIIVGGHTTIPVSDGTVTSIGLHKAALGRGVFNIMRATGGNSSTTVTSVLPINEGVNTPIEMGFYTPTIGWTQAGDGSTGVSHGIDQQGTQYNNAPSVWWSSVYRIGQPFQIDRIRIPLATPMAANMTITPKLYFDDGAASQSLTVINNTTITSAAETGFGRVASIKLGGDGTNIMRGQNNFWLELVWSGSAVATVGLPIMIEFDITPD